MAFAINPPNSPFIDSHGRMRLEWYRFFAQIQKMVGDDAIAGLQDAPYITAGPSNAIKNERILTAGDGVDVSFGVSDATVALEVSGVAPDTYGDMGHLVSLVVDPFGRITAAAEVELNSDNVIEGATNLFFTAARARSALAGGAGIDYNSTTGTIAIAANGVADTMLRQSAAFSVIGRSGNTTGDVADITAALDGQVLRRSGSALGFGAVDLSSANGVAGILAATRGGTGHGTYAVGDLLYASSTTTLAKLAVGANDYVLASDGASPLWVASTGTSSIVRATRPQFTNTIGVGTAAATSGSGVSFPASFSGSSDPNTLDDYEEGTWTPVLTASSGTITTTTSASGAYTKIGRLVIATGDVTITTNGTGSGTLRASLPFPAANTLTHFGSGRESTISFAQLVTFTGFANTNVNILKYDNSYPGADGARIQFTISYIT